MQRASLRDRRADARRAASGCTTFGVQPVEELDARRSSGPRALPGGLRRVWRGEAENDGFNQLVLRPGSTGARSWCCAPTASTCCRSASRSARPTWSRRWPTIRRSRARLAELFEARFDPAADGDRTGHAGRARGAVPRRPRCGRQPRRGPHPAALSAADPGHAAHQLLPARGPTARRTSPISRSRSIRRRCRRCRCRCRRYEIFVYSPRTEGVHLRGGKVARGGIRWSDRREDFRTEVLGLMKAQMVKNCVIVPVGAKGGFVVKRPPRGGDRAALQAEVVECYKTLIRGMLDLTDNRRRRSDRAARARGALRRRRPLSGGRRRQGHRDLLRHRERRSAWTTATGWATPSPRAAPPATTTRAWASPRAAPGNRSSATSSRWARTARPSRSPRSASATCRATSSATACCSREQIRLIAAFDHRHIFIDPGSRPGDQLRRAQAPVRAAALELGRLRPGEAQRGRRRLSADR